MDDLTTLVGKTAVRVALIAGHSDAEIIFSDQTRLRMFHMQDCCESFALEEVYGDPTDLLFTPLLMSEMAFSTPEGKPEPAVGQYTESHTDSWVKFRTTKGDVTLRFRGESNGYYGEQCDVEISRANFGAADQVAFDALVERNCP